MAWTYDSGALRAGGSTMYTSPLVVDGVLYGLSPRLVAFALDAATGEELWRYDPGIEGAPQRGLMWWERETAGGTAARLFFTGNDALVALDPAAGEPVVDFGQDGVVDLSETVAGDGPLRVTVPGIVFEDLIVMGFSTSEAAGALPGAISAYSAIDGSLVWRHHNVPRPGEPGSETWADGALETAGGANTWTGMALDAERGLLFAPTGSATPDFYGASRVGDNLFANSPAGHRRPDRRAPLALPDHPARRLGPRPAVAPDPRRARARRPDHRRGGGHQQVGPPVPVRTRDRRVALRHRRGDGPPERHTGRGGGNDPAGVVDRADAAALRDDDAQPGIDRLRERHLGRPRSAAVGPAQPAGNDDVPRLRRRPGMGRLGVRPGDPTG